MVSVGQSHTRCTQKTWLRKRLIALAACNIHELRVDSLDLNDLICDNLIVRQTNAFKYFQKNLSAYFLFFSFLLLYFHWRVPSNLYKSNCFENCFQISLQFCNFLIHVKRPLYRLYNMCSSCYHNFLFLIILQFSLIIKCGFLLLSRSVTFYRSLFRYFIKFKARAFTSFERNADFYSFRRFVIQSHFRIL